MKNSGKILIGIVIIALVAWGIVAMHQPSAPQNKLTVKIGVTLPLTGDVAALGQDNEDAIKLAQSQLPKNTKYNYDLVFADDQFSPKMGVTNANKLINVDGVSALIDFGSPVGSAVSPVTEADHITHINDFASASAVADGDYNFVDYTPSYEDAGLFISQLQKRGIKSLVFFAQQDNPGATALIGSFESDIKTSGINVLATKKFNTGTRDFRTQIDAVKNLNPDIYVFEVTSPELEILTTQLRQAGVKTPVTTMEAFEFSGQLSLFEGMWYVNGADPEPWFVDQFTKIYGHVPKFGAANGYDSLNLLVQATEAAGDGKTVPSSTQIMQALSQVKGFNGALGKNLSIDSNGLVDSKPVVRMIKNGAPVTVAP